MDMNLFMKSYFSIFFVITSLLLILFFIKPNTFIQYIKFSTKRVLEFMGFVVEIQETPKAINNIKVYFMVMFVVLLFLYSMSFKIF